MPGMNCAVCRIQVRGNLGDRCVGCRNHLVPSEIFYDTNVRKLASGGSRTGQPIDWLWTPGQAGNSEQSATDHWSRHRTVNGQTHPTMDAYVQAAWDFVAQFASSKAPQNKNPRVMIFHNCTGTSTSASMAVLNSEPTTTSYQELRMASFYDLDPGRQENSGKSIQQVLADLIGVDKGLLFPEVPMYTPKARPKKFGDL